ncbi:MAG: hypothetical protein JSS93_13980 [Bacteroidetes bacterium]|nr:hypothetical protein [Bacteroidota bacterium]
MKAVSFISCCLLLAGSAAAQDTISNPNSIERIPYYEQLYRFRVSRVIDLDEKINAGFNSRKSPISKLILELLAEGKLHTFGSNTGDPADFREPVADTTALNMGTNYVRSDTQGDWSGLKSYLAGDKVIYPGDDGQSHAFRLRNNIDAPVKGAQPNPNPLTNSANWEDLGPMNVTLNAQNIVGLELIEDVIFDKRRSRLYYDILALGIVLEDQNNASEKLAYRFYISYKELAKEINRIAHSKDLIQRQRVLWQNRYNPSEGKTFVDAFKLRLFHGVIRKVENPDDATIQAIFANNGRSYSESVFARWEEEMTLMEKEHNLWEY